MYRVVVIINSAYVCPTAGRRAPPEWDSQGVVPTQNQCKSVASNIPGFRFTHVIFFSLTIVENFKCNFAYEIRKNLKRYEPGFWIYNSLLERHRSILEFLYHYFIGLLAVSTAIKNLF